MKPGMPQAVETGEEDCPVFPEDLLVTAEGIRNYDWPVSHRDLLDFGQGLEHDLAAFFRGHPDQEQILPYKIASKNFVTTVCACFQGELLAHRLRERNRVLRAPESWKTWPNIFSGNAPPDPPYLAGMYRTQKSRSLWRRALNPATLRKAVKAIRPGKGGGLQVDGLKLGKPPEGKPGEIIIATQRLPLISRHAGSVEQDVYLCASARWFGPVYGDEAEAALRAHDRLIDRRIMEIIGDNYNTRGIALSAFTKTYLENVLARYVTLIRIHADRLKTRGDIPRLLWTGTGGYIWDVILRCEVRRRGGGVVAHDHGGGVPHLDHPEKGWVEMWSCDEFVTYSAEQVRTFKSFMHKWPNLDRNLPEISCIAESAAAAPSFTVFGKFSSPDPKIETVRIFTTLYSSEEGRGLPLYPHMPYIDWHARLIGHLKRAGYSVSIKPHPESVLKAPRAFADVLGADIVEKSLEGMDPGFDLYIFDLSNTSVLQTALMTNKPVLVVDFSVMEWRDDALALFQKRCGYVKGFYEGSRMCVDWDALEEQIRQAAQKSNDREFASAFYF